MSAPHPLPEALAQALAAYDRRQRRILLWRGVGDAALVGGVALAGVAAVDWLAHPGFGYRLMLSGSAALLSAGVFCGRGLVPALTRRAPVELARAVERAAGGLHERLSAAVQLSAAPPPGVSMWMINRTVALAANDAAALDAGTLVDARPARRALGPAGALIIALAGTCAVPGLPSLYARALWPWARIARPARTHLAVEPGDRQVALGSAITIAAAVSPDPDLAELDLVWQDGVRETVAMERDGARWRWQLGAVTRAFTYVVRAGDAESEPYRIGVVAPPRIERLRLRVTPPAYSGRPGREVDGGDAEVVAGSVVSLVAELAGEPVASATVASADGTEQAAFLEAAQGGEPARARAELRPTADLTYGVKLVGASGFASDSPQRWQIKVVADAPPTVALTSALAAGARGLRGDRGAGEVAAADDTVPLTLEARDDLGLRRLELEIVHEQETRVQLLGSPKGSPSATVLAALDLRECDPTPGDSVVVTALATDVGGQTTRSAPVTITVAGAGDTAAAGAAARLRDLLAVIDAQADSLAAQARTWTVIARAGESEDAIARRGGLALIEDRATAWQAALTRGADAVLAPAVAAVPIDAGVGHLARELRAWTRAEAEQARAIARDAARAPALIADGSAVAEAAAQDLAGFRHDLAALAARFEAEALSGKADALAARAARAVAVLNADRAWRPHPSWQPGLSAAFFAGVELQGAAQLREVGLPVIDNRDVPGIGPANFSARWEGEVSVAAAGDWVFQATADDGVRIAVDGHDLLGAPAWIMQAPTLYSGTAHLEAGWHALRVEYMQGGGGSALHLALGPAGGEAQPLAVDRLRCRAVQAADPALAQAMARLDPLAVSGAEERLARSLVDLAGCARALQGFAEAMPSEALQRLAQQGGGTADALAAAAGRRAQWSDDEVHAAQDATGSAAVAIAAVRDLLVEGVREIASRRVPLGAFPELREALHRSHDRLERIQRLPGELTEADRRQDATRAMAAARSWFEQMLRDAPRARLALLDAAQAGDADARTAIADARTSRMLGALAQLLRETLARIARIQDPYREDAEILQCWQRLDELLRQVAEREAEGHRLARADAARSALEATQAAAAAQAAGQPAATERAIARLRAEVARLARNERAEDHERAAAELELLAGVRPDLAALETKLRTYDAQDHARPADSAAETAAELAAATQRLGQAPIEARAAARAEARLTARESAIASAAEGERRREAPASRAQADGFGALARELDRFAVEPSAADEVQTLGGLADRASALAGAKGPQELEAAAHAAPPKAPAAEQLERLAAAAGEAATHADQRDALRQELRALAGDPPAPAAPAASAPAVGEALARLDRASDAEATARRRFADLQAQAAQSAAELGAQSGREAQAAVDPAARAALAAAVDPAVRAGAAARESATRAADPTVPSDELAAAARAQAEVLATGIALPLAVAARVGDPNTATSLAEVGRAAAAAAALERRAADELERAQQQRAAARAELARTLLAAGAPDASGADAATEAQAAHAQQAADGAAAEAAQRWREAAAQALRSAAAPADAAAAQQAAQSRQTAVDAQARAAQTLAAADERRVALTAALAAADPPGALVAAQAAQAADAELGALRLAEAAEPVAAEAAMAARASARPAAAAGRASEPSLRAAAAGVAAAPGAAVPASPPASPTSSPAVIASQPAAGPGITAARTASTGIAAAPQQGDSYLTAARVLGDAAQAERLAAATPTTSAQAQAGNAGETRSGQGEAGDAAGIAAKLMGPDQADWARLPDQAERRALAEGVERFSEEHQEAIRAYLRRLGEEK